MKKCAQCGTENPDDAIQCLACGKTEFAGEPPILKPPTSSWVKIAVLEHEVEAEHLDVELANRQIPHVLPPPTKRPL